MGVALITGGGHGIGRALVEAYARTGHHVILADINPRSREGFSPAISEHVTFIRTDLSQEAEITSLFAQITAMGTGLDFVINNARPKFSKTSSPSETALTADWDLGLNVLLTAAAKISESSLPLLRKSSNPSILNMASTNAFFISPQPMVYHVAKAALVQMTRYLAFHLGREGIRVNAIAPGLVDLFDDNSPLSTRPGNQKIIEQTVPLKRAATAHDIANAALFLTSKEAAYLNGHTLMLDGGITLGDTFHVTRGDFLEKPHG